MLCIPCRQILITNDLKKYYQGKPFIIFCAASRSLKLVCFDFGASCVTLKLIISIKIV